MGWEERIIGRADPEEAVRQVEYLFTHQVSAWPLLRSGLESLSRVRVRELRIRWFEVLVRHIPHRIDSTTAKVDPESISQRPCFLCPDKLPEEERGIEFGDDFVLLCNPYPILDRHLAIVRKEHTPQRITGEFSAMLDLSRILPGFVVVYNGPECGASAPDHLHFQACLHRGLPVIADVSRVSGMSIEDYARNVLVLKGFDRVWLSERFEAVMERLSKTDPNRPEPMVNVVAFFADKEWVVMVFPRGKHRPTAYSSGELIFSPASIDLCGVPVLPVEDDFKKVGSTMIEKIFMEVTMDSDVFGDVVRDLELLK